MNGPTERWTRASVGKGEPLKNFKQGCHGIGCLWGRQDEPRLGQSDRGKGMELGAFRRSLHRIFS